MKLLPKMPFKENYRVVLKAKVTKQLQNEEFRVMKGLNHENVVRVYKEVEFEIKEGRSIFTYRGFTMQWGDQGRFISLFII